MEQTCLLPAAKCRNEPVPNNVFSCFTHNYQILYIATNHAFTSAKDVFTKTPSTIRKKITIHNLKIIVGMFKNALSLSTTF